MANCHDLFQEFHQDIRILSSKKERMKTSKVALRNKIRKHFKENHPVYKPLFFTQGSQKSKNAIRYKDDMADLDDGVYFDRLPDVSATTLQKWVYDAIEDHTPGGQQHKEKCIRVIYANDYHIDLPVLYKTDDMLHPKLAVKNEGWADDDPKEFTKWFNDAKDEDGQLVRQTMYMKAWGNERSHNMPSGLCMTILTEKNCQYDDRDDICLKETLIKLKRNLALEWSCYMPTHPGDNLFLKYNDTFKSHFLNALQNFINDATDAINTDDKEKASKLWRKHLGERFPECRNGNKDQTKNNGAGLMGIASLNKPWSE